MQYGYMLFLDDAYVAHSFERQKKAKHNNKNSVYRTCYIFVLL